MINVNNKKSIKKLADNTFKVNIMRNIFAIIAIILTTVLFTSLFTISVSLQTSIEESTMRQSGGNAHGTFKNLTEKQYNELAKNSSIKDISYSVLLGYAENDELIKHQSEIRYVKDEVDAKAHFALPTTGRLPQAYDELAADTIVLDLLNIPAKLGEEITIEYHLGEEKYSHTFTLVGIWAGDIISPASQILLSKDYVETQLKNYIPTDEIGYIGQLDADVYFYNAFNIEGKMQKVITDCGFSVDEIEYGVNWAYSGNNGSIEITTILGAVFVIAMIILCGYLMISNVFYISITKDIRYYGLLKSIGTTNKQIRFIIHRQAFILCLLGTPLGLLCGFLVGYLLTPIVSNIIETDFVNISLNPIVFIASAFFSVLTVFISVSKPIRIASKISPIEALRNSDNKDINKKEKKSGRLSLLRMAFFNIFRNKKRAILVTISLSLSLVLLNATYSTANSFDMDKYLNRMISSDFAVASNSYFSDSYDGEGINKDLLTELSELNGIDTVNKIYEYEFHQASDEKNEINSLNDFIVYGVNDEIFDLLDVQSGEIDIDKLHSGKYAIVNVSTFGEENSQSNDEYYSVGDMINVVGEDGKENEYKVIAVASMPYNISVRYGFTTTVEIIIPSNVYFTNIAKDEPMLATFNVDDKYQAETETFLSDYCSNIDPYMQYESKKDLSVEFEKTQNTFICVGLVLSLLVGILGIANFANTLINSVISRKHELAMLQSIGMTRKQTSLLLVEEGIIYTIITVITALTIGSVLGFLGISALFGSSNYINLKFSVFPSLICIPILILLSVLIPNITQYVICKKSMIDRLRIAE